MGVTQLLLVEDSADDIALARRALARSALGVELEVAESGMKALDFLQARSGDLPKAVFLDLNMPELNGFDVLRRLRTEPATRFLPVVVLSTSREPADIHRSYALGANSFVTKPIDFKQFADLFVAMSSYWVHFNEKVLP